MLETARAAMADCDISWYGAAEGGRHAPGTEATIQALSGLMEVHGWDHGAPRPLGLEVASVAAGILGASGVLAASIGAARGRPVGRIETSVLAAGFLLVAHHIAAATASGEPLASPPGPQPGPPFPTSDGRWFEIEVFDAEAWKSFWARLGAGDADLGRAWTAFRARYYRGRCSLPPGLHEATGRHTLADAARVAEACQVSLCPLRGYQEVVGDGDVRARRLSWDGGESAPPPPAAGGNGELPLTGIRVVEATSRMQGPLAGLLVQWLGAEVIRVEPPGGDVGRMVPPMCGDTGSFFQCFNGGKSAVEFDLATPGGRAELLDLIAGCDVFLHNWRPGRAQKWRLDHAALAPANRRLVYAEASGWGGPPENLIGTDFLVQAHAGLGEGLNPDGDPPRTSRVLLTDCLGALVTCEGILAALYLRETTGAHNLSVATSLLEGAMACQAHVLADLNGGNGARRRRAGRPVWGPLDRPITTADGAALVVSAGDDDDFGRLCQICGVAGGGGTRPAAEHAVVDCLAGAESDYWLKTLDAEGIACAIVSRDLAALTAEPQLAAFFQPLSDTCRAPASPWTIT